jgi:hypothetical protein
VVVCLVRETQYKNTRLQNSEGRPDLINWVRARPRCNAIPQSQNGSIQKIVSSILRAQKKQVQYQNATKRAKDTQPWVESRIRRTIVLDRCVQWCEESKSIKDVQDSKKYLHGSWRSWLGKRVYSQEHAAPARVLVRGVGGVLQRYPQSVIPSNLAGSTIGSSLPSLSAAGRTPLPPHNHFLPSCSVHIYI